MNDYDLHIHSTASDGLLNVDQIFEYSAQVKLKGISITDHDTLDAIDESMRLSSLYNIDFIPGIELSTEYNGIEVHILGYYIDYKSIELNEFLKKFRMIRKNRAVQMIEKLQSLGYSISYGELVEMIGSRESTIGRPHIARILVEKGYYKDISEVFDELIGHGKPAHVDRYKIAAAEGVRLIRQAQGVPVLAHPKLTGDLYDDNNIDAFIQSLIESGLSGIEVYHSAQDEDDSSKLLNIAGKYNMVVTGGSDCHGKWTDEGYIMGKYGISKDEFSRLADLRR